jgi:hypothetical protein
MCDHTQIQIDAESIVTNVLREWLFPPRTRVTVEVLCKHDTRARDFYGAIAWSYLPYQDFVLRLRCDFGDRLEWLIRHELAEAMLAEYADLFDQALDHKRNAIIVEQHQRVRDAFIEWFLAVVAPQHMPPSRVL